MLMLLYCYVKFHAGLNKTSCHILANTIGNKFCNLTVHINNSNCNAFVGQTGYHKVPG